VGFVRLLFPSTGGTAEFVASLVPPSDPRLLELAAARNIITSTAMTMAIPHSAANTTSKNPRLIAMPASCQTRFGAASENRPLLCACVSARASASAASGAGSSASFNIRCTILATAIFCAAP